MITEAIIIGVSFMVGCFILLAAFSMKSAKLFKRNLLKHTYDLKVKVPKNQPIAHAWINKIEAIIDNEPA